MSDLDALRSRILQMLGDLSAARYSAGLLEECLRLALDEYSRVWPALASFEIIVAEAGRCQPLDRSDLLAVVEVFYPGGPEESSRRALQAFAFFWRAGQPVLFIGGGRVPQPGEQIWVTCAVTHGLAGLDAAANTTVRGDNRSLLVLGAAGLAAALRASDLSERYGSRASDSDRLQEWARARLAEFRAGLQGLRASAPRLPAAPARSAWRLDRWDE